MSLGEKSRINERGQGDGCFSNREICVNNVNREITQLWGFSQIDEISWFQTLKVEMLSKSCLSI